MPATERSGLIDGEPSKPPNLLLSTGVACLACVAALLFGYTLGYTSPALLPMEVGEHHAFKTRALPGGGVASPDAAVFSAILNLGAMVGALAVAPLSDRLGRRSAILAAAALYLGGWLGLGVWRSFMWLCAARLITGLATGIASGAVPMYIAETAPTEVRGTLMALNQLGVVVGIFLVYLLGEVAEHVQETSVLCSSSEVCKLEIDSAECLAATRGYGGDRHCYAVMSDPVLLAYCGAGLAATLLVAGFFLLPETPQSLMSRGYADEAQAMARRLGGDERVWLGSEADRKSLHGTSSERLSLWEQCVCLGERAVRKQLVVAFVLMATQQFAGVNAVIFYSSEIAEQGGLPDPNATGVLIMGVQVAATLVAVLLMDRAGRRLLLLLSLGGLNFTSASLAFFFAHDDRPAWLAVTSLTLYITSFSIGLGAIPWLIMGEIFPPRVRALASSLVTLFNWACSFVVTLLFSAAAAAFSPALVFVFFTAVCMGGTAFVWACVPETKGRTLHEIQELFNPPETPGGPPATAGTGVA